jgi:hypothetical protein
MYMMIKDVKRFFLYLGIAGLVLSGHPLFAQLKLGDNMGSHKATKDIDLQSHNINTANLVAAKGVVIGTATALSNTSVALQVDGADKAIVVPRVTDLLNATAPSIPVANAINGMIVYDLATSKFYHRQNNAWVVYADAMNYVDRFVPQVILGLKTMKSDSGFVATGAFVGTAATVPTPIAGAGTRMMWYPGKAAFRAGTVPAAQWDLSNIGIYSTAFGNSNMASGSGCFAIGFNNFALGENSFVTGNGNQAIGINSFAIGRGTHATGLNGFSYGGESVASGNETMAGGLRAAASGQQSVALGLGVTASGVASMAFGANAVASGFHSLAIGTGATASGDNSMALGAFVDTNLSPGSMCIGDNLTPSGSLFTLGSNSMNMRFAGGYILYSSSNYVSGVILPKGESAWSMISDKRKKENFEIADAESFLMKIDTMQLGSWNYKKQDLKIFRHYGPMAQDFYGAFGKDSYGTVGCDTLINSADFDGVNLIAIKGLVKRTKDLLKENDDLKRRVTALESENKVAVSSLIEKNEILNRKLLEQENNNSKTQRALARLQKMMEKIAVVKLHEVHVLTANNNVTIED